MNLPYTPQNISEALSFLSLTWGCFAFVLVSTLAFITVFFRSQWINNERLTYPIIQIPLEMTQDTSQFFKRRAMWTSFGYCVRLSRFSTVYTSSSLKCRTFPSGTSISVICFEIKPWTAMGMTRVSFYPFMIGLVYFSPLDLSLSTWFFFLVWKAELITKIYDGMGNTCRDGIQPPG